MITGKEKIKAELEHLKNVRRPEIIARIAAARELGDLSENADYQSAKEEQAFLEGRIKELERQLKEAEEPDITDQMESGAGIGSKVVCQSEEAGESEVFELTVPQESDPVAGKISAESPIGRALLGHQPGDVVDVETPDGMVSYRILKIE